MENEMMRGAKIVAGEIVKGGVKRREGFNITDAKGFQLFFANGWGVSVQFGPCNYGSNYSQSFTEFLERVLSPEGELFPWWGKDEDTVKGYQTADEVAALIAAVSAIPLGGK